MALTPEQLSIIRCEVNRAAEMGRLAGMRDALPIVAINGSPADDALVSALADAAGYTLATWEASTLRAKGRYDLFNKLYDAAEVYANAPNRASLVKRGSSIALFIAGLAQLRGVQDPCGLILSIPGLAPPDPDVMQATTDRPAAPTAPAARHRGRRAGFAILGGMSAAALGLVTASLLREIGSSDDVVIWSP